mmetsp:Transcript_9480/g.25707  ORF Transcript_9480/g.25707 Transcript_9480/m.25707 type:complete len:165 (-) Transcript_9480:188-682(-)
MVFAWCCTAVDASASTSTELGGKDKKALGLPLTALEDEQEPPQSSDVKVAGGKPALIKQGSSEDIGKEDKPPESTTITVKVVKTPLLNKLGLDTRASTRTCTLRILQVKLEGLIAQWNRDHPDRVVRAGDMIVEVNGISQEKEALYEAISRDTELNLIVQRAGN